MLDDKRQDKEPLESPLNQALKEQNISELERLIKSGVDPASTLKSLIDDGQSDKILLLIQSGVDPSQIYWPAPPTSIMNYAQTLQEENPSNTCYQVMEDWLRAQHKSTFSQGPLITVLNRAVHHAYPKKSDEAITFDPFDKNGICNGLSMLFLQYSIRLKKPERFFELRDKIFSMGDQVFVELDRQTDILSQRLKEGTITTEEQQQLDDINELQAFANLLILYQKTTQKVLYTNQSDSALFRDAGLEVIAEASMNLTSKDLDSLLDLNSPVCPFCQDGIYKLDWHSDYGGHSTTITVNSGQICFFDPNFGETVDTKMMKQQLQSYFESYGGSKKELTFSVARVVDYEIDPIQKKAWTAQQHQQFCKNLIEKKNWQGLLQYGVEHDLTDFVQLALSKGASSQLLLEYATQYNKKEFVDLAFQKDASVDALLSFGIQYNNKEFVALALQKGATVDTLLRFAIHFNKIDFVEMALKHGISKERIIELAVILDQHNILAEIFYHRKGFSTDDFLRHAIYHQNKLLVEAALELGASSQKLLEYAVKFEKRDFVDMAFSLSAKESSSDKDSMREKVSADALLHYAVMHQKWSFVDLALEKGASHSSLLQNLLLFATPDTPIVDQIQKLLAEKRNIQWLQAIRASLDKVDDPRLSQPDIKKLKDFIDQTTASIQDEKKKLSIQPLNDYSTKTKGLDIILKTEFYDTIIKEKKPNVSQQSLSDKMNL